MSKDLRPCEQESLYLTDIVGVDHITYRDYFIVMETRFGLWRPVIFKAEGPEELRGVCSGLVAVPTRNEAYRRGKDIVDEIHGD